ncbi:putative 2OG-Fe(II) oxygenase [Sphingomonas sp. LB-2]|uniref:2OG-Fe(II) oxygenase family protein n=1 Tax=Sphingomonas caeni TaxID=2984949 RepID=UPI0022319EE3|nr:putative 2OG-Fe(II) oxygenase [Sphingomonas caeni]MCW3846266.1 putative 2OG-Fe(II) oxygenase [Sphingomonas caeni]
MTEDLAVLARQALERGEEAEAAPVLAEAAARARTDARLWQWSGSLHRALDEYALALAAFAKAAALAPDDPSIAFGRALVAFEAGLDAVALFEAADRLVPRNSEVLQCMAAARVAAGDGARAIADLDAVLVESPGWLHGHHALARIRSMMGQRDAATASIERALAARPRDVTLWQALIDTLSQGEHFTEMGEAARRARAAAGEHGFDLGEAIALSETGDAAGADALFARIPDGDDPVVAVRRVRHFLRTGRVEAALPLIERWAVREGAALMWPYAAIGWRLAGDPRLGWLEDPRLVSVIDLADKLPPLDRLAGLLRGLHLARAAPMDQSVRGGTQTDGMLFTRIEPEICALRAAMVDAVEAHIAGLPPPDPAHPVLALRRDRRVRFSGSWSVRLGGAGRHINHVHPMGWLSSALYIALPEPGPGHEGWLQLGAPQASLGLDLPPLRWIEPRPGRLVLFPSTLWHGTVSFAQGERLTVAFDVAPPR